MVRFLRSARRQDAAGLYQPGRDGRFAPCVPLRFPRRTLAQGLLRMPEEHVVTGRCARRSGGHALPLPHGRCTHKRISSQGARKRLAILNDCKSPTAALSRTRVRVEIAVLDALRLAAPTCLDEALTARASARSGHLTSHARLRSRPKPGRNCRRGSGSRGMDSKVGLVNGGCS